MKPAQQFSPKKSQQPTQFVQHFKDEKTLKAHQAWVKKYRKSTPF